MQKPIRAIALRWTSVVCHDALERFMRDIPFEYCASLGFRRVRYSRLAEDDQPWFDSAEVRSGVYAGVDHTSLLPLDEELICGLRGCEAIFMYMIMRQEYGKNISYTERKRQYLLHLRFWNDFLERRKINLFLSSTLPHEIPDHIIYALCKYKGIRTVFTHVTPIRDTAFLQEDIELSAVQIKERLDAMGQSDVTLSPKMEEYFAEQTRPEGRFTFIFPEKPESALVKFSKTVLSAPTTLLRWIPTLLSSRAWFGRVQKLQSAWLQRRLRSFYDRHAVEPDLGKKYIYFPLQYQPECSTCPMAGAFVDQSLSIQLLSSTAPSDVLIYVKEHPRQRKAGTLGRTLTFYKDLSSMRNVRLVRHATSTFALREHCSAVATGTGTAGLEALFRGKPVFLFGHTFYQYAPAIFRVRAREDCVKAMEAVFQKNVTPDRSSVRRFLKAVEDTRIHASVTEWHLKNYSDLPVEESTRVFTDALRTWLR